jgi:hypothetical protein
MATVDKLPSYVYCDLDDCGYRHFLSLNRDVQGKWSIGYVAFTDNGELAIAELCLNGFDSIDSAAREISKRIRGDHEAESWIR